MIKSLRPSPFSRTLALMPPLMVLTVQIAEADIFVKIENSSAAIGIPGESREVSHPNWIEAYSMQFGVSNPTTLANGSIEAGKAARSDLVITKALDRSSPPLFLSCAQGTRQPKVVLEVTSILNSDQVVFYRITLTGVVVSSLSTSGGTDGSRPTESVSLSYEKITTEYYMPDISGKMPSSPTATSTWNFLTNTTK